VLSKIILAVVGTLMILPHLAVAADNTAARPVEIAGPALPTFSIESICSDAQWAGLGESSSSEYGGCIRDERFRAPAAKMGNVSNRGTDDLHHTGH
jgi:hypothetical protein